MVAVQQQEPYFTPEAYFAWEVHQLEKHELIEGKVYAMSGGSQNHSAIAINLLLILRSHLRGGPCRVFNSDLKVNLLNTANYTYPDLSVTCDRRDQDHALYITYPCLIVEVLSPSTEAYDRGKKFQNYRRNPNLIDYVLVSSEEIAIEIYHKNSAGEWVIKSYQSGDLVILESIDLTVPIEQIYEEIRFESPA
ncbi:MAG: Uma2 family endonuclease [Prochlorothrix sp.]